MDYLYEISTARFIICNARMGEAHYFYKRLEQVYIQTWHSSLRLKKIEGDAVETLPESYIKAARIDSAKIEVYLPDAISVQIYLEDHSGFMERF